MSMVSELIREAPAYKKAVLAVAVTAGVGACVYYGYRHLSGPHASVKPRGPSKPPSKSEEKSTSQTKVPEPVKEEHLPVKPEPVNTDPPKANTDPPKAETLDRSVLTGKQHGHKTASPLRAEELSTSVTFEKISLGPESENFEHVSLSQINPLGSSPRHEVGEKRQAEDLSMSQADPSISFISTAEEEQKEKEASKSKDKQKELQLPQQSQGAHDSSNDEDLATAASVVSVKDENDIVVVETNSEESGVENSEETRVSPRSGMAATDIDFDSSRISPVFGQQTYHRVDTEPEELVTFDPARSHPASFGFKFESNI